MELINIRTEVWLTEFRKMEKVYRILYVVNIFLNFLPKIDCLKKEMGISAACMHALNYSFYPPMLHAWVHSLIPRNTLPTFVGRRSACLRATLKSCESEPKYKEAVRGMQNNVSSKKSIYWKSYIYCIHRCATVTDHTIYKSLNYTDAYASLA